MSQHYVEDSATAEYLIDYINLVRDIDGVTYEYRNGLHTVDGVVSVTSGASALELIAA